MMNRKKAIIYLVLASVLWSIGGLFIKLADMNSVAIAGLRSGISAVVMIIYLRKPVIHISKMNVLGGISYSCLLFCFVIANKLTTSANAIFLQFTGPIWMVIFSAILLKEKPRKSDLATIAFVLAGMALFFTGNLGAGSMAGNLVALLSGVFMAAMVLFLIHSHGSPVEITLLGNVITFIISIPFLPRHMPDAISILSLLALGIFQLGISYILYSLAIKHVTAIEGILIPVIEPLLNPIWVLLFTGEKMGIFSLVGGAIIIGSVLVHELYIEKQLKKEVSVCEAL